MCVPYPRCTPLRLTFSNLSPPPYLPYISDSHSTSLLCHLPSPQFLSAWPTPVRIPSIQNHCDPILQYSSHPPPPTYFPNSYSAGFFLSLPPISNWNNSSRHSTESVKKIAIFLLWNWRNNANVKLNIADQGPNMTPLYPLIAKTIQTRPFLDFKTFYNRYDINENLFFYAQWLLRCDNSALRFLDMSMPFHSPPPTPVSH